MPIVIELKDQAEAQTLLGLLQLANKAGEGNLFIAKDCVKFAERVTAAANAQSQPALQTVETEEAA